MWFFCSGMLEFTLGCTASALQSITQCSVPVLLTQCTIHVHQLLSMKVTSVFVAVLACARRETHARINALHLTPAAVVLMLVR